MRKTFLALIIFALVSSGLFIRSIYFDKHLSSDQTFFQLVYLGKTDAQFSDYQVPALNAYVPFQLTNYLRQWIADPIWVYRSILPLLIFFYLLAFYWILKKLVQKEWIAILVPLISLVPRTALASQYWGIFALGHATHRSFAQPFFVLFFYLLFRYRKDNKLLLLSFLGLGIISALYPTQALYLTAIGILTLLMFSEKKIVFLYRGLLLGVAFAIGTLYYIIPNLTIGLNIDALAPEMISKFNEALRYRFAYTFYPAALYTYTKSIILDIGILSLIYVFINQKRIKRGLPPALTELLNFSNNFLYSVLLITFGLPLLQDLVVSTFRTRIFVFDQFGEFKFVYLSLFIGLGIFFYYLTYQSRLPLFKKRSAVTLVAVFLILANFFFLQDAISKIYPLDKFSPKNSAFQESCAWINKNTSTNTILITEDFNFRLCTKRKLFVTWKEGMVPLYQSPRAFIDWYNKLLNQNQAYAEQNLDKLFKLIETQPSLVIINTSAWSETEVFKENPLYQNSNYLILPGVLPK